MKKLEIKDLVIGDGQEVKSGDIIVIHYTGQLLKNDIIFDSSYKRNEPLRCTIGIGQLIKGWDMGIIGLKVGGKRELLIPSKLAYGNMNIGNGLIPPNSDLKFIVELIDII